MCRYRYGSCLLYTSNHLILDNTIHSVTIEANKTATYTATNKWKQGKLKLRKFDSKNGKQIEGATYGIYNEQNQELQRLVTRATGYAAVSYTHLDVYKRQLFDRNANH